MDRLRAAIGGPLGIPVEYIPSPNRGYIHERRWVRCIIWHITDGAFEGALDWLTSPASQASSNYIISRQGRVVCLVPPDESAWANGRINRPNLLNPIVRQAVESGVNPNTWSVSIEWEGKPVVRGGDPPTNAQLVAGIRLTAWLAMRYNLTVDYVHLFGHRDWDSVDRRDCPGFTDAQWVAWTARAREEAKRMRGW